ncbi:5'/3'-nucleotidase SurE [Iamia majanohamensis]|uniref:5'-nucleotidase n=1 Tax=Iamia majanohamensis TaxID=467976 RepID=A0AAE9Y426_9ACTN|nr:5'/3'-nucleotidase SurE [Iamia majanohamensis]WCO65580.1 5'/3'-nucleotidase SurE [Iamia majanohamensis]
MHATTSARLPLGGRALAALVVLVLLLGASACGGDDDGSDPDESGTTTTAEATEGGGEEAAGGLSVLVTNDDGYDSEGIDAVVTALEGLDGVTVDVVAPLEQQSGQGGTYTEGAVETQEEETASGTEAVAVDGYPADAVRVALEDLGLEPDLVVSGINEGQNLGPLVDISGTVGAARAAVAAGVPALALSGGLMDFDAEAGVPFLLDWVEENREALEAGDAPVEVVSINIPSCTEGEVRGLEEVPVGTDGSQAIVEQDCTSTLEDPADDLEAFNNGFATLTVLPDDPATPYQPG